MEPLNRMAMDLVDEAIDFAEELTIEVHPLEGDAAVLDFGVEIPGAIEAGLVLAEIQTAGLATVQTTLDDVADTPIPRVELSTDHPAFALLCGAKAGWELSVDGFEGLGSGPARALVGEEDVYNRVAYEEDFDFAVLAVETDDLPDRDVASHVAERAGVPESGVFLLPYATASVTGSVVAASRAAELAVFRLFEAGYDPLNVLSATGSAPLASVSGDEPTAIARTNDALAYGGQVHLVVDEPFDEFESIVSTAGEEYGVPFEEIFEEVEWAMQELPVELFGPAQVTVDVVGGETHTYGAMADSVLAESFGL